MIRDLYEQSQYNNILCDINGVYLPLDTNWKNIGIAVSGGADSALLAYLLCSLITDKKLEINVHIISNIRMWKLRPWQKWNSLEVYNYLCQRFPNIKFFRHENFVAPELEYGEEGNLIKDEYGDVVSGDVIELRSFAEFISHWQNLDAYYNSVTKNPSVSFPGAPEKRNIEPVKENFHLAIKKHMNFVACHPFRFTDKSWIISQYKNLKLWDLLELTRSCEGDKTHYNDIFKNLDYSTYTPGQYVPTCGRCFWCKEREWAIEQSK